MRTDRESPARSSPPPEPIHLEFYGSDGPGWRPVIEPPRVDRPRRRVGPTAATLAALALVLGVAVIAVDAAVEPDVQPATTVPTDRDGPEASETTSPATRGPVDLATLPPATVSTLPFPGGAMPAGRYATDVLGVPLEFTLDVGTALRTVRPGTVLLTPRGTSQSSVDGEPHVQFLRVAGWNTREEAADRMFQGVGGIGATDVDAWIADNDVIVDARRSTLVDGRATEVFDLYVDPASPLGDEVCRPAARPCFWFVSVAEDDIALAAVRLDYALSSPMNVRMWLIDVGRGGPLLVEAAAVTGADAWLDEFEATTIATMTIGEPVERRLPGPDPGSRTWSGGSRR